MTHPGTPHHYGPSHPTSPCVYEPQLSEGYGGIAAVNGGMVAQSTYDGMEASAGDLRLMAAAPDLLAAVQAFIKCDHDGISENDHVALMILYADALMLSKYAIAKATGVKP